MPVQLAPEITSHDNISGISICAQQHTIMIYQDQVPQYQIECIDKIIASAVHYSYVYYATETQECVQLNIYDGILGIMISQSSIDAKPQLNNIRFLFSEHQLYLLLQQSNTDYLWLFQFHNIDYSMKKLKISMADSNSLFYKVTWATDFAIYQSNMLLMYSPEDHIIYQWNISEQTESQVDKEVQICYLLTDPLKIQGAIFLYINNRVNEPNLYIKNDQIIEDGKLIQKNNFFDVIESNNQYILIQDGQKLVFNNKQLLTQFLAIKGVVWSQEEIIPIAESISQSVVENNYQQKLLDYVVHEQILKIRLQCYNEIKDIQLGFLQSEATVHGFLYIQDDVLLIAINDTLYLITKKKEDDSNKYTLKEILKISNYEFLHSVIFQFKTQQRNIKNPLDEILICCNYQNHANIYDNLSQQPILCPSKIVSYTYLNGQISFVSHNVFGIIKGRNLEYITGIESDQHLLDIKVYCQNCYIILSQTYVYLVILFNNTIFTYKQWIQTYQPRYLYISDSTIQIFGLSSFEGGGTLKKIAKLYHLSQNKEVPAKDIQRYITSEFANLRIEFNTCSIAEQLSSKADCHAAMNSLTKCFPSIDLLEYSFNYLSMHADFLGRYTNALLEARPHTQFRLLKKLLRKIALDSYQNAFGQLMTSQTTVIAELDFGQLQSYYLLLNYIHYNILRQSVGVFIIFAKVCKITDSLILWAINAYKDTLLQELDVKTALLLARQAGIQLQTLSGHSATTELSGIPTYSAPPRSQSITERWLDLVRTVSLVYGIQVISGNKIQQLKGFEIQIQAYEWLKGLIQQKVENQWNSISFNLVKYVPTNRQVDAMKDNSNVSKTEQTTNHNTAKITLEQYENVQKEDIELTVTNNVPNDATGNAEQLEKANYVGLGAETDNKITNIEQEESEDEWATLESQRKRKLTKIRLRDKPIDTSNISGTSGAQQAPQPLITSTFFQRQSDYPKDLSDAIALNTLFQSGVQVQNATKSQNQAQEQWEDVWDQGWGDNNQQMNRGEQDPFKSFGQNQEQGKDNILNEQKAENVQNPEDIQIYQNTEAQQTNVAEVCVQDQAQDGTAASWGAAWDN